MVASLSEAVAWDGCRIGGDSFRAICGAGCAPSLNLPRSAVAARYGDGQDVEEGFTNRRATPPALLRGDIAAAISCRLAGDRIRAMLGDLGEPGENDPDNPSKTLSCGKATCFGIRVAVTYSPGTT